MTRRILTLLFLLAGLAACNSPRKGSATTAPMDLKEVFGCWAVDSVAHASAIGMDQEDEKQLSRSTLCFEEKRIKWGDLEFPGPEYGFSTVNPVEYLWNEFYLDPRRVGISSAKAQRLSVFRDGPRELGPGKNQLGGELFVTDRRGLVWPINGVFFVLEKIPSR